MRSDDYIVHVVDDEEAIRKSLAFLLTMAGFTVRLHETATSFLSIAPDLDRGCLVTDLRMPDMSGVELLQRLQVLLVPIAPIVISGHGDVPMAVTAMKTGALDFIEKPFADEVLIDAIKRAAATLVSDGGTESVATFRARIALLTCREHEVLDAVVEGLQNKVIAYNLNISPRTVEVHRANLMAKMLARNLSDLIRMTLAAGRSPR
jgi:two-component system response regulator FixJ